MNKFLTKIAGVIASFAMVIGVGVGVASKQAKGAYADSGTATFSFTTDSNDIVGTDLPGGVTVSHINLKATKNGSTAWRSGHENLRVYQNAELTITGDNAVASIDNVKVTAGGSYNPSGNYTFVAKPSNTNITYDADGMDMPSNTTSFVITRTTSGRCDLASIIVSYTESGGVQEDGVTVSLNKENIVLDVNGTDSESITATVSTTGNATNGITAESSNESVATVSTASPSSGVAFTVEAVSEGEADVIVTSTWDENVSCACHITVYDTTPRLVNFKKVDSLAAGQRVLITTVVNGNYYYLPSATCTDAAPNAVSCTYNETIHKIVNVDINKSFIVSGTAAGWKFNNVQGDYLRISGNDNNRIRVGTEEHSFTATSTEYGYYLQDLTHERFVGIYNETDWRCYASRTASNYKGTDNYYNCDFINFWVEAKPEQTISGATAAYTDETVTLSSTANNPTWSIVTGDTTAEGAQITAAGVVSATGAGVVKVKASHDDYEDAYYTITFTVRPVDPFINVNKNSTSGFTGQHEDLSFDFGNLNSDLNIVSSNTSVVTVNEPSLGADSGTVRINFVGVGETTVKFNDGETEITFVTVAVSQSTVSITGLPSSDSVYIGETLDLGSLISVSASGIYSDDVNWSSDNEAVASVNQTGVVTGEGDGTAIITVTSADYPSATMSCEVSVSERPLIVTFTPKYENKTFSATVSGNDPTTSYSFEGTYTNANQLTNENSHTLTMNFDRTVVIKSITMSMKSNTSKGGGTLSYRVDEDETNTEIVSGKFNEDVWNGEWSTSYTNVVPLTNGFIVAKSMFKLVLVSTESSIYCQSYSIEYEYATPAQEIEGCVKTRSTLSYSNYTNLGNDTFEFENIAIRFGGTIDAELFEAVQNVTGYGVLVTTKEYLDAQEGNNKLLKNHIDSSNANIQKYDSSATTSGAKTTPTKYGNLYKWNVYYQLPSSAEEELTRTYVSVAYIKTSSGTVFFKQVEASAQSLALDLIDSNTYETDQFGGSLYYLATLGL